MLADLGVAGRGDTGTLLGTTVPGAGAGRRRRRGATAAAGAGRPPCRKRRQGCRRTSAHCGPIFRNPTASGAVAKPASEASTASLAFALARSSPAAAISGTRAARGDEVELAEDEHAEGLGEKQQSVDVARHQKAQHGRTDVRDRDARAASLPAAVKKWAERRPDEREGRDREQQVEQHLALGGAGRDREEERTRQRHRDAGRAGRLHGVDERQAAERLGLVEQAPDGGPDLPADPGDRLRLSHAGHGRGGSGCRAGPYPAKSAP